MKTPIWIVTTLATAALMLAGCSKSDQSTQVDSAPVEKSFASADPSLKSTADRAVTLIKEKNYQGAMQELQKLGANVKLTDEQKQAVKDVITQVQQAIKNAVEKATGEANKALGEAEKILGK